MKSDLNWNDLRYFLAVVRTASLTQAARVLKVSQPTVGRRLKALEDCLGVRLLERQQNEISLTGVGERLVAYAEQMERGSHELERSVLEQAETEEEAFRVTAISSVALFLTLHWKRIRRQCEGVELEIISTGERLSLARNEADMALRMGRVPKRGNLVSRRVGTIAYTLYANREIASRFGRDDGPALHQATFIGLKKNPKRPSQSQWLSDFGSSGSFPLRVNELGLRYQAAVRGLGVTLLPCHLGDENADLVRLIAPPPELLEDVFLLVHTDVRDLPRTKTVSKALTSVFKDHRSLLLGQR